ncbi:uncharacterized protein [Cicer arietinum]|uniref:uncharacterized protein n=1 Tax=Cicer arietinum TaxID=3827 RepID=UPI003CC69507
MTVDKYCFMSLVKKDGGSVTFGNYYQAQIKGKETIGKKNYALITDVQYVEGLKYNLLSIRKLCDKDFEVIFNPNLGEVIKINYGEVLFSRTKKKNLYVLYLEELTNESCFMSINKEKCIWHKQTRHISMKTISKISKFERVRGLPKLNFDQNKVYEACAKGKQGKSNFHSKDFIFRNLILELFHIDLFGLIKTTSLGGMKYGFVIVDDFS